ncbi:TetR/AcrR family transcriptional regulator C-terminal domain-containing protein [Streptomyces sp. CC208A]|uniref:TetR/AcrR family transcriptional regulator C-terminal domain-containing protein n=1 Tax=Streptomyces sp. CC208A TaxID=3044573 RepID=UPI0024A7F1B0|nr:TetR/AcrR family transcriptional regulator C-terminal domain-containing protein [Streptomyces sp. CC208A]
MVVFAGQGDFRRSLALLWRTPGEAAARSGPGPRPGLTVDAIVDAGIALADTSGISAVSMREVGKRVGRTGMALYTYVPGKGELVDLMYDRALAELPTDYDLADGWRAALSAWAHDYRTFCLRHPWILQVSQARPVLGPNDSAVLETLLRILFSTGLSAQALRRLVGTLVNHVRGAAQTVVDLRQAATATGVSDEDWWAARSAAFEEVVPDFAARFPAVVRLSTEAAAAPPDPEGPYLEREATETFDAGLAVLLDGIEALVRRGAPDAPRAQERRL